MVKVDWKGQELADAGRITIDVDVLVVGGGASGALAAVNLTAAGFTVAVADDADELGRGVAYSTPDPTHLLNVAAGSMSAFCDRPAHFVEWARDAGVDASAASFVPRRVYGDYLASLTRRSSIVHVRDRVVALDATRQDRIYASLRNGGTISAPDVVLAPGNPPPGRPCGIAADVAASSRYVADPWAPGAIDQIDASGDVVLLGSGLTAIDVALAIERRVVDGDCRLHAVSRHGLRPLPHLAAAPSARPMALAVLPRSASELAALVRRLARDTEARGDDWRVAVDQLRPHTSRIWQALPPAERKRFVCHAARYWDVHRHRTAPEVARHVDALTASERLTFTAGRVVESSATRDSIELHVRCRSGAQTSLRASTVVNCTGPNRDPRSSVDPLLRQLLRDRLIAADPLGLGFTATDPRLLTIGPPRQGELWESTAIPEIRAQAAALPELLGRSHDALVTAR